MVHFLAIASIKENQYQYLEPKDYTQILAAFPHTIRMIVLHHCFAIPENHQPGNQEHERQEHEERSTKFFSIRNSCLVIGTQSPMDTILCWLRYGLGINKMTRGNEAFEWSEDMTVLRYHDEPITIAQFPILANIIVTQAQRILVEKLCFGENMTEHESFGQLKDSRLDKTPGASIMSYEPNRKILSPSPKSILTLALRQTAPRWKSATSQSDSWNALPMQTYLHLHELFLDYLVVACHILGGQPPRGCELLRLRITQTAESDRNLFLLNGQVMMVLRYHKGQAKSGMEKIIPRFVPAQVGKLVLCYLYFVRPFIVMIQRILRIVPCGMSSLMWAKDSIGKKSWDPARLRILMQRHTERYMGVELHIQGWRQIAVAMDRDLLRTPKDLIDSTEYDDEGKEVSLLEQDHNGQVGHSSKVADQHYGLKIGDIPGLDQSILVRYRSVARKWHHLMGMVLDGNDTSIVCIS